MIAMRRMCCSAAELRPFGTHEAQTCVSRILHLSLFACHNSSDFLSCAWHACDLYLVRCCLCLSLSVVVFVFADAPISVSLLALSVSFPNARCIRLSSVCFASPVSACCDRIFTLDACGFCSCSCFATIITFPRATILPVLFFLFFHSSRTRSSVACVALNHRLVYSVVSAIICSVYKPSNIHPSSRSHYCILIIASSGHPVRSEATLSSLFHQLAAHYHQRSVIEELCLMLFSCRHDCELSIVAILLLQARVPLVAKLMFQNGQ